MAVEILTVSLSDESIGRLAMHIASLLKGVPVNTESNPPSSQNPQGAEPSGSGQQADPWQNPTPAPYANPEQYAPPQPGPGVTQVGAVQQANQGGQNSVPTCAHGPKKWVPPGFSQNTGKSYAGFWACPAPRGQQCPRS